MSKMFIRVSMRVTRIFEVDQCDYSEDGNTPEPKEDILVAELEAAKCEPFEFLEAVVVDAPSEFIIIDTIEVQEVIPCQTH